MKLMVAHKMHVVKLPSGLEMQTSPYSFPREAGVERAAAKPQSPEEEAVMMDIDAPFKAFRNRQADSMPKGEEPPKAYDPEKEAQKANAMRLAAETLRRLHSPLDPDRVLDESEVDGSRIPENHGIPEAYSDG